MITQTCSEESMWIVLPVLMECFTESFSEYFHIFVHKNILFVKKYCHKKRRKIYKKKGEMFLRQWFLVILFFEDLLPGFVNELK